MEKNHRTIDQLTNNKEEKADCKNEHPGQQLPTDYRLNKESKELYNLRDEKEAHSQSS